MTHNSSMMALFPLALVALSTVLDISYKISTQLKCTRTTRRRLTAVHAFTIEAIQVLLLGTGLLASSSLVGSEEEASPLAGFGLVLHRWPALPITVVSHTVAIIAIDIIDNFVQLGRFQHPFQTQAFLLTRSKLLPHTVRKIKKRVIWELDGIPIHDRKSNAYATPVRSYWSTVTPRRAVSASPSGKVAQIVSAFEEDIRRASPQRWNQPEPYMCISPEHDPNLDSNQAVPCPAGCGGLFVDNHYAYQHMLSDHYPWICRLCNPTDVVFLEAAFDRPRSLARHLRLVHGLIWQVPEYPPVSRTSTMQHTRSLGEAHHQPSQTLDFSPTRRVQQQPRSYPYTPPNPRRVQFAQISEETGHSTPATTPPTPDTSPDTHRMEILEHLAFLEADGQSNAPVELDECAETQGTFPIDATVFNPSPSPSMPSQEALPAETVDLFTTKDHCRSTGPVAARHTAERLKQRNMKVVSKDM